MHGTITERLQVQRKRLADAARSAGRDPDDVTLIAVSKKQPVEAIREAYAAGQRDFGENYVQELVAKAEELATYADIRWHMIGHLQSNKARFVAGLVHRVHTVSSEKLARELEVRVAQRRRTEAQSPHAVRLRENADPSKAISTMPPMSLFPLNVLIEVNVSGEPSKSGCTPEQLPQVLDAIAEQSSIHATGLMTMPPAVDDARDARPYFDRLFELREKWGGASRLPEMSMGMSHDAEEAVAAGATYVRIGSAIFGPRST